MREAGKKAGLGNAEPGKAGLGKGTGRRSSCKSPSEVKGNYERRRGVGFEGGAILRHLQWESAAEAMCGALALTVNGGRWRRGRRWHVEGDREKDQEEEEEETERKRMRRRERKTERKTETGDGGGEEGEGGRSRRGKRKRKTERRAGREEYSYYLLYLLDRTRIIVRWNPVVPGSDL